MKIGLLSPFLPEKDGIAIYSDNILMGLGKDKKHIITIGRKGSKADYIVNFRPFSLKKELKKIIKKEQLDAIHIQYVPTLFGKYTLNYNLINALNLKIKTIVTLHEVHYQTKGLRNKILAHIEKQIIKKADKIIVHTPRQKEFLERLFSRQWKTNLEGRQKPSDKKYRTKKIICIYHGLRLNDTHKRKNKNILCFGMISQGKGIKYLIKAMDYLPDCKLTIAGSFVDKKTEIEIKKQLKQSKADIQTDFGWIEGDKKADYYKNADLVVLPHIWAPYQSGILHNSVAYGLPVVVTKTGALWEMVALFKFGVMVKPKSSKALAEGIRKVFKDYKKYKAGTKKYREVANWPKIAKEHLSTYKLEK